MTDAGHVVRGGGARPAPWVLDLLLGLGVTLTVSLFIVAGVGRTPTAGSAYLWAVGLGALMLVRRRYPVLVVAMSVGALVSYYAAGFPPIGVAVPVAAAVFSAAEHGRVVAAVVASASVIVISVAYRLAVGQDPALVVGYELPGHALLLAGAVALGDSVRSRRQLRRQSDRIADLVADRYAREAERRVMAERLAIARELHDSVGHALTVVTLHTQVVEDALDSDQSAVRRSLQAISDTTSATFEDLRRTVAGLRHGGPVSRSPLRISDLGPALAPAEQAGLTVRTRVPGRSDLPPLSPAVEAAIYRIVQESITNVVRHSDASTVEVDLREADGVVTVTVADDGGDGRAPGPRARVEPGNGIAGMRERTEMLGGTFCAGRSEQGFTVRASIPVAVQR